jgi:hypothetical protein
MCLWRNEKVRGSNPLSSTKPAGQRPCLDPGFRSRQWHVSRNSEFCYLIDRLIAGEFASELAGDRRGLAEGAVPPLYGGDDHFTERGPRGRTRIAA